ncbi:hypothetical protein [Spongiimicrobium sp. 2-473A-2-J]|uniref:hypothetical protein n=1 Tax=Eudoraea algarum TaxID=3417568 RepID=UPI003D36E21C
MSNKNFYIKPVIPRRFIQIFRIILLLVLLVVLFRLLDKNFDKINDSIECFLDGIIELSANSLGLQKLLKLYGFGGIIAFIIYVFKKFFSNWYQQIKNYLKAKGLPDEQLMRENWVFGNVKDMIVSMIRFFAKYLRPITGLKVFFYFVITFLLGWLGIKGVEIVNDEISVGGDRISHIYQLNSENDNGLSNLKDPFKLVFSFDHDDKDVEKHGTDELDTMKRFLKSFKGCLGDTKDRVKLEIRGYVSETLDDNYKSEIELANDRARNTEKQLLALMEKIRSDYNEPGSKEVDLGFLNQIEIEVVEWQDSREEYEKLIRTRIFEESKDSTLKEDEELLREFTAEYLNRRVEVSVIKAGSCYP